MSWQDLKDHMRQAGNVDKATVLQGPDGRSKGCGIVVYQHPKDAQRAMRELQDSNLKGRPIFVREDREKHSGGDAGGAAAAGLSVFVGNLAFEVSWQDLKDHMRQAGNVDKATVLQGSDGRSKGCAIVVYQNPNEAQRAIRELQDSNLKGRPIFVREDREQGGDSRSNFSRDRDREQVGDRRDHGGDRWERGGDRSNFSRDPPARGGYQGAGTGSGAGSGQQLFVGNLSFDTNWKELKELFGTIGSVDRAEVMEGPDGKKKGFGTVRFYNARDAEAAIDRLNGVELQGRHLDVRIDNKAR